MIMHYVNIVVLSIYIGNTQIENITNRLLKMKDQVFLATLFCLSMFIEFCQPFREDPTMNIIEQPILQNIYCQPSADGPMSVCQILLQSLGHDPVLYVEPTRYGFHFLLYYSLMIRLLFCFFVFLFIIRSRLFF